MCEYVIEAITTDTKVKRRSTALAVSLFLRTADIDMSAQESHLLTEWACWHTVHAVHELCDNIRSSCVCVEYTLAGGSMPPSTSYCIWEMHGTACHSQLCWAVTCAACVLPISVKTRKLVLRRTSNCNVRYATLRIVRAISALIAHGDSTSSTIRNWSATRASDATASWSHN